MANPHYYKFKTKEEAWADYEIAKKAMKLKKRDIPMTQKSYQRLFGSGYVEIGVMEFKKKAAEKRFVVYLEFQIPHTSYEREDCLFQCDAVLLLIRDVNVFIPKLDDGDSDIWQFEGYEHYHPLKPLETATAEAQGKLHGDTPMHRKVNYDLLYQQL